MKKQILVMISSAVVLTAHAQKNSVLVFGNFEANSTTEHSPGGFKQVRTTVNVNPGIGYQVSDNWTLGVEGIFNYIGEHQSPAIAGYHNSSGMSIGGGLFARYTIPITNQLFFYTQGGTFYSRGKSYDNGTAEPGSGSTSYGVSIAPGIGFHIKNGYALNLGLGNIHYSMSQFAPNEASISSLGTTFGHSFSIGLTKNFLSHKTKEIKAP